jgi:acyl-CoA synthetase (AMP-forming)/AMP-acid ligase II
MASSGETVTYGDLNRRSNQLAQLFHDRGLRPGDHIAIMVENHLRFLEVAWGAQRSGLYYTPINSHLTAPEAAYIVDDCAAKVVVSSHRLAPVATRLDSALTPAVAVRLMVDGTEAGWASYEREIAGYPTDPIEDECEGEAMPYSSGTTGRPKGIMRPLSLAPLGQGLDILGGFLELLEMQDGAVYLSPAPMYHSAPLLWSMAVQRRGATVVVMEHFEPAAALALIERFSVTHSQWVPTMFVRMLKLPEEERSRFDLSSHRWAIHAAAPCPATVKKQMIDWWGPILWEYYSATEGVGATHITSDKWLSHPGSVGRSVLGTIHILDDDGTPVDNGQVGTVWFEGGVSFKYHNDEPKTAGAHNQDGFATVGDVGYVDDEGFLYLTDRKAFTIIAGGVNIYPQEAENVLVTHPKVLDAAVIGVPDQDLGESVKAVVQPIDWSDAGPELAAELLDFCRQHLASYKCPRSVDFEQELPRLDTGKLYKQILRARYREQKPASEYLTGDSGTA